MWSSAERREASTTANYIADVGRQLGLKMKVRTVPLQEYATWAYDPAVRARTDLALTLWWTDVAEPLQALWQIVEPGAVSNYNAYGNPAAVQPLSRAFGEADDTARADGDPAPARQSPRPDVSRGQHATLTWMAGVSRAARRHAGAFTPVGAYVGAQGTLRDRYPRLLVLSCGLLLTLAAPL